MNVAIYARVSSERQAERDLSIPSQLKALHNYATQHGFRIVREFIDNAETGCTTDRPAFREMISLARLKTPPFQSILVWKLSRFARNREDSIIYKSLLRKKGVQVISINEPIDDTPAGHMLEGMIEVVDEFYSANLAQEVSRGMRECASRGFFTGGHPPYGYDIKKVMEGNSERSTLTPALSRAPLIQRIFTECDLGKGQKTIAQDLNRDGYRTANGEKWSKNNIQSILKNEAYTGTLVWGRRSKKDLIRVPDAWPTIIDRELFERVQRLLKSRSPKVIHPRRVTSDYLLSGIVKCEACGRAMSGHSAKSGKFQYYRCANALKRGPIECPTHWIPKDKIEGFIVDKIRNCILTDENLIELVKLTNDELGSEVNDVEVQLDTLIAQIKEVEKRLEHLYDALEQGDFTSSELAPRIRKWEDRKSELELRKQNLEVEIQNQVFEMPELNQIMSYVDDLKVVLGSASILEQRAFLRSFVEEVQVGTDEVTIHYTIPMPPANKEEEKIVKEEICIYL